MNIIQIKTTKISTDELYSKLCENIGIFIQNYKSTNPGSNKVVYGPCEQDSEEEIQNLDFSRDAKSYFCKKKFLVRFFLNFFDYAFMYLEGSVLMSRFQN